VSRDETDVDLLPLAHGVLEVDRVLEDLGLEQAVVEQVDMGVRSALVEPLAADRCRSVAFPELLISRCKSNTQHP